MARTENVVFDMGGVLLRFDPGYFSSLFVDDAEDAEAIARAYFGHPSWALLDAGVISDATMERLARGRLPERLWPALRRTCEGWALRQPPIRETNDLVVRLHEAGLGCYLLSNVGERWWRHQRTIIPCMGAMDGALISATERLMKPDPRIYLALCERYGLDPACCLFVDDNADNVAGSELAGMRGYLFDAADPAGAVTGIEALLASEGVTL